jgi:RHS repeat-associated protein
MTMSQVVPNGYYYSWDYASVAATYTWDNQGRMTSLSYPGPAEQSNSSEPGPVNTYTYDAMGNLASLSQQCSGCQDFPLLLYSPVSANATYNQAGQVTGLTYGGNYPVFQETRSYNSLLQLTTATAAYASYPYTAVMNMQYNYSATQNNGRIVNSVDGVAGQHVSYTYDALNRLSSATTLPADPAAWGQTYSYDGFGNLTSQLPTQGSAPLVYPPVDSTTNHVGTVDANGNPAGSNYTWDVENRLLSYTTSTYTYDPWGKRIVVNGSAYLYGIDGKPLATYAVTPSSPGNYFTLGVPSSYTPMYFTYFGGRLLEPTDRLGSMRFQSGPYLTSTPAVYFPWGQEQTSTQDGTFKFAGYWRDATGGSQDYADQRYYNATYGRFWTPDPGGPATANLKNPTSWNRYAYVNDDPANFRDPSGLFSPDGCLGVHSLEGEYGCNDDLVSYGGTCLTWGFMMDSWYCADVAPDPCTASNMSSAYLLRVQGVACSIVPPTIPGLGTGPAYSPIPVITLQEIDDCIYPGGTSLTMGVWDLEVEYQVLVNGQAVNGLNALNSLGISVAEQITPTGGNVSIGGGTWCPVGSFGCSVPGTMSPNGTFWDDLAGQGTAKQSFYDGAILLPVSFGGASSQTVLSNVYDSTGHSISVGGGALVGNSSTRQCETKSGDPTP